MLCSLECMYHYNRRKVKALRDVGEGHQRERGTVQLTCSNATDRIREECQKSTGAGATNGGIF